MQNEEKNGRGFWGIRIFTQNPLEMDIHGSKIQCPFLADLSGVVSISCRNYNANLGYRWWSSISATHGGPYTRIPQLFLRSWLDSKPDLQLHFLFSLTLLWFRLAIPTGPMRLSADRFLQFPVLFP